MINVIRCGGVLYFLFMWFASLVSYSHTYRYVVKLYEHLHKKNRIPIVITPLQNYHQSSILGLDQPTGLHPGCNPVGPLVI